VIERYSNIFSKREVITKVCKMKYRSAQRKLRIAKYIHFFPEIASMTQRQAERYISLKLKSSKNNKSNNSNPNNKSSFRKIRTTTHNHISIENDSVPLAIPC
jgi:hypothetical protein